MSSVYVLAVLGDFPAVLTELLWWLSRVERRSVAGIEVWTTRTGDQRLRELVAKPEWGALQDVVGVLPALAPGETGPAESHGFRSHVFEGADGALDDVRSEGECTAVSAALHDRVRALRRGLSEGISIVGSLAGGRKTMSAALQTAFSLQAREEDRLVHTILHADLEAVLRRSQRSRDYVFPAAEWASLSGVDEGEQIVVYDVSVPRLRTFVGPRLGRVLESEPYADVWPALGGADQRELRAVLERTSSDDWHYEVRDVASGEVVYASRLTARAGSVLAAMVLAPPGSRAFDLAEWLDGRGLPWEVGSSRGNDDETRSQAVRQAVSDLRSRLSDLPVWLRRFGPPESGYAMRDVDVRLEP